MERGGAGRPFFFGWLERVANDGWNSSAPARVGEAASAQ